MHSVLLHMVQLCQTVSLDHTITVTNTSHIRTADKRNTRVTRHLVSLLIPAAEQISELFVCKCVRVCVWHGIPIICGVPPLSTRSPFSLTKLTTCCSTSPVWCSLLWERLCTLVVRMTAHGSSFFRIYLFSIQTQWMHRHYSSLLNDALVHAYVCRRQ